MERKNHLDEMGLWLSRKKLCYTTNGYLMWMPTFVMRKIVRVWNKISCLMFGHYYFPDTNKKHGAIWSKNNKKLVNYKYEVCVDCMKRKLK